MATKKGYYKLDEVGFVGVQKKSKAQVKRDMADTVQFIRTRIAGKAAPSHPKTAIRRHLVKAK